MTHSEGGLDGGHIHQDENSSANVRSSRSWAARRRGVVDAVSSSIRTLRVGLRNHAFLLVVRLEVKERNLANHRIALNNFRLLLPPLVGSCIHDHPLVQGRSDLLYSPLPWTSRRFRCRRRHFSNMAAALLPRRRRRGDVERGGSDESSARPSTTRCATVEQL